MDKGLKLLMATYWNGGMWKHKEPTAEFIDNFAEKYQLELPFDIFFDASALFELF